MRNLPAQASEFESFARKCGWSLDRDSAAFEDGTEQHLLVAWRPEANITPTWNWINNTWYYDGAILFLRDPKASEGWRGVDSLDMYRTHRLLTLSTHELWRFYDGLAPEEKVARQYSFYASDSPGGDGGAPVISPGTLGSDPDIPF